MTKIKKNLRGNLVIVGLLFSVISGAQVNMKDAIGVKGISFPQVASAISAKGFLIDKIDSNYQTITTEWKTMNGDWMNLNKFRMAVRMKDSTAIITGQWQTKPAMNSKYTMECFDEMNKLALSFNKPVEYLKQ